MKPRTTRTCRRDRAPWFLRALNFLRLRSRTKRCGDLYLDETATRRGRQGTAPSPPVRARWSRASRTAADGHRLESVSIISP